MIDGLAILTCFDHRADKNRRDLVILRRVILVPGYYQQAIVRFCPLDVAVYILLQPGIPLLDCSIVHVVLQIRYHNRERGQSAIVSGKACPGQISTGGDISEVAPRVMLASIEGM